MTYLFQPFPCDSQGHVYPDSKIYGANIGTHRVLSAPDGPHVDPMNLAIRVFKKTDNVIDDDDIYVYQQIIRTPDWW